MTNGQLIDMLSKYPKTDELDIQLFSRNTVRRGDVPDQNVKVRYCTHNNHVCLQIDFSALWDEDIRQSVLKMNNSIKELNEKPRNI